MGLFWGSSVVAQPSSKPIKAPYCGDQVIDEGEECDDGNRLEGDDCASDCQGPGLPINAGKPLEEQGVSLLSAPVDQGQDEYRSPRRALWLSTIPTALSYAALTATLVHRSASEEKAIGALSLSIAGVVLSPSVGMFYAKQPKLALGLTGVRLLSGLAVASSIADIKSATFEEADTLDAGLLVGSAIVFTCATIVEFATLPNAARRAQPPGTTKPPTLLHQ